MLKTFDLFFGEGYNPPVETLDGIEYLTVAEAAERKNVTPAAIYRAVQEGRLAYVILFGRRVLRASDVAAWESAGHGGRRPGQGRPPKGSAA